MGPVQVLVVGFDRPTFSGAVLAELVRLREAGIVRLVDLLLVSRTESGGLETLDIPASVGTNFGELAGAVLGWPEGAPDNAETGTDADSADGSTWSLADAVPAGAVVAVALIEHLWAEPLTAAIRGTGGTALEEAWLAPADLEALDALVKQRQR
jgi:hypothetical protein